MQEQTVGDLVCVLKSLLLYHGTIVFQGLILCFKDLLFSLIKKMKKENNFTQFIVHHFKDIACLREGELGSIVEKATVSV